MQRLLILGSLIQMTGSNQKCMKNYMTCARDYQCDAVDCGRMLNYPDGREVIYQKKENCFDQFENSIVEGGDHWIRDLHIQDMAVDW